MTRHVEAVGDKARITDGEIVVDVAILQPEEGKRHQRLVRVSFRHPWSRPKVVGLWGGGKKGETTTVVIETGHATEWMGGEP